MLFTSGVVINGPTTLISPSGRNMAYVCHISCTKSTLITWLLNGSLLSTWTLTNYAITNNYQVMCDQKDSFSGSVFQEYLELDLEGSLQLQCVSIYNCDDKNSEDCVPSVCFSQEVHICKTNILLFLVVCFCTNGEQASLTLK